MMHSAMLFDQLNSEVATLAIDVQAPKTPEVSHVIPPECGTVTPEPTENAQTLEMPKEESSVPGHSSTIDPVQNNSPTKDSPSTKAYDLTPSATKKALTNKDVTDHTASLWKYFPIPINEPEPAPEYLQSDLSLPGGHIIAARVRGKKHKHEGSNCDDWYEIANVDNVIFVAVSDGAGSKKFSRIGARESCKASVSYLANAYKEMLSNNPALYDSLKQELSSCACMEACGRIASLVQKAVMQARDAVEAAYYSRAMDPAYSTLLKRSLELRDLSGTLLVAAIIPLQEETKEHLVVACQVGDGMIVSINSKGLFQSSVKLLGVPDSGDFSGETEFLTATQMKTAEALQKRTKLSRGIVDTVMLMSDGVADDYFPNETQMRRLYFDLLINGVIEMDNILSDLSNLSSEELRILKQLPGPILYPWVNDRRITVPIQYTNRICDAMGVSLEDLWKDRSIIQLASLQVKEAVPSSDTGEKLRIWLDNYYERGSFDDRTLVVIQL